ncbi:MAG: primary-amine oxidase [Rhizobiales bacterium]|nr:primary-amine oxidase [Hyphomicrobiales bacterium]
MRQTPAATPHALDPLSAEEIAIAAEVVRGEGGLDASAWFETITLDDMTPQARAFPAADGDTGTARGARFAYVCCYEPSSNRTLTGQVDLAARRLVRFEHVPGAQARITFDEFVLGGEIAKADAGVRAALAKRGIAEAEIDRVVIEPWAAGNFGIAGEEGMRLAYGHCWLANDANDNAYARPIAGLHPVIDLRARKVLRVDDFGAEPLPPDPGPLVPATARVDLKPLDIVQPEGPSFTVDGYHVAWQGFELRVGFDPRDGLILRNIGYREKGRLRPIMRRAALAEMVVPYGDPRGGNFRRNAFDTGEYGIGQLTESLKLGCDCLGHMHYFDVHVHDWNGAPVAIENAVCMHEEDYGILWKFTDAAAGVRLVARSRRLVISSISTIGNYVYGLYWYFYQDGTIGVEIKATGIPFPSGIVAGDAAASDYATVVGPGVESHVHQHNFCFRFDMCVDGAANSVEEVNCEPLAIGPGNPHGNAARIVARRLGRESEARRTIDLASARYWKVINTKVRNAHGAPVGYKLVPGANTLPFNAPEGPIGRRAGFMYNHLWVTPFAPEEKYPAGWFPNQHAGGDGLPRWTEADRAIDGREIVAWYTLNYHHVPRPEDFPIQPVVYAGFHWMAAGFFDANPAMDVPQARAEPCCPK